MAWTQDLRDLPRWNLIVRVKGVLRRTFGSGWLLNILRGSLFCLLWRWLPLKMLKRQSLPTVLFRTPFTRTIKFHRAINYFPVTCHAIVYTYLLIKISPHACTSVTSLTHLKETWDSFSFKASREMYQGCKQLHECILRYRSVPSLFDSISISRESRNTLTKGH